MKILLMFIIPTILFANYKPIDKVSDCTFKKMYVKKRHCKGTCIKVPLSYNCEFSEVKNGKIRQNSVKKKAYIAKIKAEAETEVNNEISKKDKRVLRTLIRHLENKEVSGQLNTLRNKLLTLLKAD